jgi:hypothetical protein
VSAAAAVFLAMAAFSWMYVRNLSEQLPDPESRAGKEVQPKLLSQAAPQLPQPAASAEKKPPVLSKPSKEKPLQKKIPSLKKVRKKRIGATLFPGIFPAIPFAGKPSEKLTAKLEVSNPLSDTLAQTAQAEEHLPNLFNKAEDSAGLASASEIESIEFHPASDSQAKLLQSEITNRKKGLRAILSGQSRLDFSSLPTVDEAKGLLISGIGRLIGLKNPYPETEQEKNESSEL